SDTSVVVLQAEMRDELLALQVTKGVLQLHQLNEQVVLRVDARRMHRALEVERQPLLDPRHAGARGEVEKERGVEHDWRRKDAVAAQEIDLQLHLVAKPAEDV